MTAPKDKHIDLSKLKERLEYCADTGLFTYKQGVSNVASHSVAGNLTKSGYVNISYNNRLYRAHRLAWYYSYGKWPSKHLDHINGQRNDNRLCNLREATASENMLNKRAAHSNNMSSSSLGVYYKKDSGSWHAHIRFRNKAYYLGTFRNEESASAAYQRAKSMLIKDLDEQELKELINENA